MAASGGVNEIAGRYATALFDLAEDQKKLDAVADDLRQVESMLDDSEDLRSLVQSPVISREDQQKGLVAVLDKMEAQDLTKKFVGYVAANRRAFALRAMIKGYLAALAERRGEVTAEVTTAKKLTKTRLTAIEKALKEAIGSKVTVTPTVNPDIIGGMIVKVGSRMVDSSVSTQLQKLKLAMKGA